MDKWKEELLEHLFDLACDYYTEETDDETFKIPDNQKEKQFIQEVFTICGDVLGKFDSKA